MAEVQGVHHVALSVSDVDRSAAFYEKVFEGQKIMEADEADHRFRLYMCPGGLAIGLHEHAACPDGDRFSEFRCGLDHLAFGCKDRAEVEAWEEKLNGLGVENSGITDAPYGHVLVFRDPDNIQLEFFAMPS